METDLLNNLKKITQHTDLKIDKKKVLEISHGSDTQNVDAYNEEIKIIFFKNFETIEELKHDFSKFNLEFYPKAFVIQVEGNHLNFLNEVTIKCCNILLVQFSSPKGIKNYVKNNDEKNYKIITLKAPKILEKIRAENFNIESLFAIKNSLISNLNLNEILNYENLKISELEIFLYAINSQDEICYRILNIFDSDYKFEALILNLIMQKRNFNLFLAFLDVFKSSEIKKEIIEKIWIKGNIFLLCVKNRNLEILKFLYENFKDFLFDNMLITLSDFEEALNICIEKDVFEIFEELKKFKFNGKNKLENVFKKGGKILKEIENFHKEIKEGNLKNVEKFTIKYKNYLLCYKNGVCALEHALDCKQFKIFSFLRAKNFISDKKENFSYKIESLTLDEKDQIRKFNIFYMKNDPKAFISKLTNKCEYDAVSEIKPQDIREMLTDLSQRGELEPIFMNVSHSNVKIFFNFSSESVKSMDPTRSEHTFGITYNESDEIYVGKLKDKFEHYGNFTHELSHYLLYLVYENDCKPYCKSDKVRENLFAKILKETSDIYQKDQKGTDPIIRYVFQYSLHEREIELAVRVPHMIAKYFNDENKLKSLRENFSNLFNFYENLVLPDLKIQNIYRIINLNNKFGLLQEILDSKFQAASNEIKFVNSIKRSKIEIDSSEGCKSGFDDEKEFESSKNSQLNISNERKIILNSNFPQLTFSTIINKIKENSKNKLDLKVKNFWVNAEKLSQEHLRVEFEDILKNSVIDRIFVQAEKQNLEFLENLKFLKSVNEKILVIGHNFENFTHEINHDWNELTEPTKEAILNKVVNFQGNSMKFSEILPNLKLSNKIFPVLGLSEDLKINSELGYDEDDSFFVPRIIQKFRPSPEGRGIYDTDDFTLEEFLEHVKNEKINLISDNAGSGKTTILKKIHKNLVENFKTHWITFISLKDKLEILKKENCENFEDFMIKLLELNEFEGEIFKEKISRGEVKILFDAFDEISPICKEKTLKLFNLFKIQDKNQIFITTRTHLEKDLERELKIPSFTLKILPREELIKVLKNSWKNSNDDEEFIEKCAEKLVGKVNSIIISIYNVIGLPLIIQNLAQIYKDKIDENFEEKIGKLRISVIFSEAILKANLKVLKFKFPNEVIQNVDKNDSLLKVFEYLAIKYFFGEEILDILGFYYEEDEWTFSEITRGGIVTFLDQQIVKFIHQTFAEFLVANFTFKILKNVKNPSVDQINFFREILIEEKFHILRIFLNDLLENFDVEKLKILNSCEKVQKYFDLQNLQNLGVQKLINLVKLFLKILRSNSELYKKFINVEGKYGKTILMEILPEINDEKIFNEFLEEISNFFGDKIVYEFLLKSTKKSNTILKSFAGNAKNVENLKTFFEKFFIQKFESEKIKEILWSKSSNILHESNNISFTYFLEIFCQYFEIETFLYDTDEEGRNMLHILAETNFESSLKLALEKLKNILSKESFEKFLSSKSKNDLNILNFLIMNQYLDLNRFLNYFYEISGENFENLLKSSKGFEDGKLLASVLTTENSNSFEFLWEIYKKRFSDKEFFKILCEYEDEDMGNFLHIVARQVETNDLIELIFSKLDLLEVDFEDMQNFMLLTDYQDKNALLVSIEGYCDHTNEDAFLHLFTVEFEAYILHDNFLYETDIEGQNLIHYVTQYSRDQIVEFVLYKLKNEYLGDKEEYKDFLKSKTSRGLNIFHLAVYREVGKTTEEFFDIIKSEFSDEEIQELLSENDAENCLPLHCAVIHSDVETFNFLISLYENFFQQNDLKEFLKLKLSSSDDLNFDKNILEYSYLNKQFEGMPEAVEKVLEKYEVKLD